MMEIIFLRSKQYAYKVLASKRLEELKKSKKLNLTDENVQMKMKGTSRPAKEKNVRWDEWNLVLKENKDVYKKQTVMQTKLLEIYIAEINKKAMGSYDDKRKIEDDNITTRPFGYETIVW